MHFSFNFGWSSIKLDIFDIDQNLKYKVRGDLNMYSKTLMKTNFIEIMNTKQKI